MRPENVFMRENLTHTHTHTHVTWPEAKSLVEGGDRGVHLMLHASVLTQARQSAWLKGGETAREREIRLNYGQSFSFMGKCMLLPWLKAEHS